MQFLGPPNMEGLRVMACLLLTMLRLAEKTGAMAAAPEAILSTVPIFPQIRSGQEKTGFPVLVSVEAPKVEPCPINIIVVHSVSEKDMLQTAVDSIAKQLHGPRNRITLVGSPGDSEQAQVVEPSSPDKAREKLESLNHSTASSIKLKDLFQRAIKILKESKESDGRPGFILLLTDGKGLSHEDLVDVKVLVKKNSYTVDVFVLGSDHDSENLYTIASESAGGTYSFVKDVSPSSISTALAVRLGSLKSVVVHGPSFLELHPSGDKTAIRHIDSGAYSHVGKKPAKITIGVLHKGETKKFLMYLDVPAVTEHGGCGKQRLLTAKFYSSYNAAPIESELCIERPQRVVQKVPSPEVVQHIVRIDLINMIRDVAGATDPENELNGKWSKFEQSHQYWSGVDVLLGELEHEIQVMKEYTKLSSASSSLWVAYFNSWMSSYQTQRPTAMGSSSNVAAAFLTQEVNIWLQLHIKIFEERSINVVHSFCPDNECDCIDVHEIAEYLTKAWQAKEIHAKPCSRVHSILQAIA